MQLGYKPKFLLSAYDLGVDSISPNDLSTPAHLVLNFSLYCHKLLRVQTNLIKAYKRESSVDPTSPYTQVYPSPTFPETEQILKMTSKNTVVDSKKEEASKLYLLSESQLRKLLSKQEKPDEAKSDRGDKRKRPKSIDDAWSMLLSDTIPQMLSIPPPIRQKAMKLGSFFQQNGVALEQDDNSLIYQNVDDNQETINGSNAIDTLLFFVTTNEARFSRPRDLFSLCRFLIVKKAPSQLFHPSKEPLVLLKSLKKFYSVKNDYQ